MSPISGVRNKVLFHRDNRKDPRRQLIFHSHYTLLLMAVSTFDLCTDRSVSCPTIATNKATVRCSVSAVVFVCISSFVCAVVFRICFSQVLDV